MTEIKVGGVPEHFNLPWHHCIENGSFENQKLDVSWTDFPGGTGEMCSALRNDEIDVAVILTEGIIKDITVGNKAKIAQTYIASPLLWGIHVAADSEFSKLSELENRKVAISRKGSGSHLMAYVNAKKMNWNLNNLQFQIVKNIDGAVDALTQNKAQYFMWEQFTTKPLVDKGIFRRIDSCPTPWPCFVIAVRSEFLNYEKNAIERLLKVLNEHTSEFKKIPDIAEELAAKYDQKVEDIKEWLELTQWSQEQLKIEEVNQVQDALSDLNLINKKYKAEDFLWS